MRNLIAGITALVIGYSNPLFAQTDCFYLPQGVLVSWSDDRNVWDKDVSYQPVFSGEYPNQTLSGYQVNYISDVNALYEFGIRSGDTLVALNGIQVTERKAFNAVLARLSQQESLLLEFSNRSDIALINTELSDTQCL